MYESDRKRRAEAAAELARLIEQRDFLARHIFPIEPDWRGIKNVSVEVFEELEIEIAALTANPDLDCV